MHHYPSAAVHFLKPNAYCWSLQTPVQLLTTDYLADHMDLSSFSVSYSSSLFRDLSYFAYNMNLRMTVALVLLR